MPNQLKPLFTDIANAIREKTGTTASIPATSFPSKIRSITGGGGTSVSPYTALHDVWNDNIVNLTTEYTDGITTIPEYAFASKRKLKTVILSNSVKTISGNNFYFTTSLESINLGQIETVNGSVFTGCYELQELNYPNTTRSILTNHGYCKALKKIVLNTTSTHDLKLNSYSPWCNSGMATGQVIEVIIKGDNLPIMSQATIFDSTFIPKIYFTNSTVFERAKTATNWSALYTAGKLVLRP